MREARPNCGTVGNGIGKHITERTPLLQRDCQQQERHIDPVEPGYNGEAIIVMELSNTRLALIMATAWSGVFLSALGSTIIAALSAPISSEFKSLALLPWLATSYLISAAASQSIAGRLTDIYGRGPSLVFVNLVFAAGNLICGMATSQGAFILGRVFAGIGGGGLMSIPSFLASDLIPLRKRGLVNGFSNLWYSFGAMVGSVLGGFVHDYTTWGWRLAFLIQVPPALLSALFAFVLIKMLPERSAESCLRRIDFLGAFLVTAFLVLLMIGLNMGGNSVPWSHPLPLTFISLSLVLLVAFVLWERRAPLPILPVRLLLQRTILCSCLASLLLSIINMSSTLYLPLYFEVRGSSPTEAGIKMLPSSVGISVGALGAGLVMRKTGKYMALAMVSMLVVVISSVLFTFQGASTPSWWAIGPLFIFAAGYNSLCTVLQVACTAATDHLQQAVVTSAMLLARSLGASTGVAIASAIYQSTLRAELWKRFNGEKDAIRIINLILNDLGELQRLPQGWSEGVIEAYMEAFQGVWLARVGCTVLALICIATMKQYQLYSTLNRSE
ncbi:major facilitator superfamily domain-containing protein [Xylaria telfairii]|nr:major facilitator superfamily domain-containing protein [Xylaria telfairii]